MNNISLQATNYMAFQNAQERQVSTSYTNQNNLKSKNGAKTPNHKILGGKTHR